LRNTARALERVVRAELETYILPADLRHFADVDPDWQSKRLATPSDEVRRQVFDQLL
jgi:hypothetical protein